MTKARKPSRKKGRTASLALAPCSALDRYLMLDVALTLAGAYKPRLATMALIDVLGGYVGNRKEMVEALGASRQAYYQWLKKWREILPPNNQDQPRSGESPSARSGDKI